MVYRPRGCGGSQAGVIILAYRVAVKDGAVDTKNLLLASAHGSNRFPSASPVSHTVRLC